jgi:hypothetical protein
MRYKVNWPADGRAVHDSRFAAWNGRVVDVTMGLRWAVGKTIENTIMHIHNQGGFVEVEPYSAMLSTLSDKIVGAPPKVMKPTDGVTVTRSGPDNSNGD